MALSHPRPLRGLKPVLSTGTSPKAAATLAIALASALVLAGCASSRGPAPEGRPLDADSLQTQRSLSGVAVSDAAFPTQDWWTTLGDAQLDSLIDEALQGTPSLAAADARLRQAVAQAGLADAQRKPTLGASGQTAATLHSGTHNATISAIQAMPGVPARRSARASAT